MATSETMFSLREYHIELDEDTSYIRATQVFPTQKGMN